MALRGKSSKSFLRTKDLLSFSEIAYDKEGNYIYDKGIIKEALKKDKNGKLIRNKNNIANILTKYGVIYRMIFNAMNMDRYTYDEIQEALDHLSNYIAELGVSGIIEFHAADQTQNSDHIHFWISSEDRLIYNKIAKEMVNMGYSNEEDIYIQKYEDNKRIDEIEYVNKENKSIRDRFTEETKKEEESLMESFIPNTHLSQLEKQYFETYNKINNLLKEKSHTYNSTTKNNELNRMSIRIQELKQKLSKKDL